MGQYVKWVSQLRTTLPQGADAWGVSIKYLMGAVVGSGTALLGLYSYMQRKILSNPECASQEKIEPKIKKKKIRMSTGESFKFLMSEIHYGFSNFGNILWNVPQYC